MTRLPFDPQKLPDLGVSKPAARERARHGELSADRPLTVTQLTELIKQVLADRTPSPVRVVGEVSNFSVRTHWYLSLKDEANVIACVMWASAASKAGFEPQRGQQVVATGRLDYYGPQGRLQMYIDRIEPVGQGTLEIKFRQLCEELRVAGFFDDKRKKPLPPFPRHLAVITSANGAAVADVIRTARNRLPGVAITVVDVRVQGASAAPEIAAAIAMVDARRVELAVDAIVLTRGGGSLEDLWAFNERSVADAVFACHLPIVAAIGHETDTTIAELVADLRCSTPTQAAERLVPDAAAERQHLSQVGARLTTGLRRRAAQDRARLDALATRPIFRRPAAVVDAHRQRLAEFERRMTQSTRQRLGDARHEVGELRHRLAALEPMGLLRVARGRVGEAANRLTAAVGHRLSNSRKRIDAMSAVLEAVSPQRVLERGFSYTTDETGQLIRSVSQATAGQRVVTNLADGRFESIIDRAGAAATTTPQPQPSPPQRKKKPRGSSDAVPGLFG